MNHRHTCYGCGMVTFCQTTSCNKGDTESCMWCPAPNPITHCGHCGGNGISGHDSSCPYDINMMSRVLGKENVAKYLDDNAKAKAKSADLSRRLDVGDSWRAHALGVLLT